jgi:hypothetical protein
LSRRLKWGVASVVLAAAGAVAAAASGPGLGARALPTAALGTHDKGGVLGSQFSKLPGSHDTQLVLLIVLLGVVVLMLGTLSAFLYAYFTR